MNETLVGLFVKSVLLTAAALAMIFLLRRFAARRVSAAVRHLICLFAFASLSLLPVLSFVLPIWRVVPITPANIIVNPTAIPTPTPRYGWLEKGQSFPKTPADWATPPTFPRPVQSQEQLAAATVTPPIVRDWTKSILMAYAMVAFALLSRLALGHLSVWQIVHRAKLVEGRQLGGIPVRESDEITVPLTVGVGRSAVIVLPTGFASVASPERLEAVLAHETAHVRRGDYVTQTCSDIVCALYFVNPLVWVLGGVMRAEAERAADNHVLAENAVRPSEYAAHLLETVRNLQGRRGIPGVAVTMARRSEVSARIGAVLAANVSRVGQLSAAGTVSACCVVAAVVGAIAMLAPARGAESPFIARTNFDGGHIQEIAPGIFAEIESISKDATVRWEADGTRIPYTDRDDSRDTITDTIISGHWLTNDNRTLKLHSDLKVYARLSATGEKPIEKLGITIGQSSLIGKNRADVKGTIYVGDTVWKLGRSVKLTPMSASEYARKNLDNAENTHWKPGKYFQTHQSVRELSNEGQIVAVDLWGNVHTADGGTSSVAENNGAMTVVGFGSLPPIIRGFRYAKNIQERHEIVFRNVALEPLPQDNTGAFIAFPLQTKRTVSGSPVETTKNDLLGAGRIAFHRYDMRPGLSIVYAEDTEGRETRLTFKEAYSRSGGAKLNWRSTRPISIGLKWDVQVPPGVSPTLGCKPVLLLKKGLVKLPDMRGGFTETLPNRTIQKNDYGFRDIVPADVVALIYVPINTPFSGDTIHTLYPAPKEFQPPRTMWQGRGTFRPLATVAFTPGRTFRRTPGGNAIVFTVQVAPENDPAWTMGRQTAQNAIVQTHDTTSRKQERRLLLVEKNGTVHEMSHSHLPVVNPVLDGLWAKAMGKPPVYGHTTKNDKYWQSTATQFPKEWIPRLKEIRLETRPYVEVPYIE